MSGLAVDRGNSTQYALQVGAVAYVQSKGQFFAPKLGPILWVKNPKGILRRNDFDAFMGNADSTSDSLRGDDFAQGGEYQSTKVGESSVAYHVKAKGRARDMTTLDKAEAVALGVNYEQEQSNGAMFEAMIAYERAMSLVVGTKTNYAAANQETLTGTRQWTDQTNSTPIKDIQNRLRAFALFGNSPELTQMRLNRPVWDALSDHPSTSELTKYTQTGLLTRENVKAMFDLGSVEIMNTVYNAALDGIATPVPTAVYGNHVMFLRIDSGQSQAASSFVRTVSLRGQVNADGTPIIKMGRLDPNDAKTEGWSVSARLWRDIVIHAQFNGAIIVDCV